MSFIDRIAAAILPPETEQDRATARRTAEAMTSSGDWLAVVLNHHRQIETCFAEAFSAANPHEKNQALRQLGLMLTAHANAEESVLYPALADIGEKTDAGMAYEEQAMAKIQMAKMERLDPMSEDWRKKLEHIQGAVLHHMYEEEGTWFPKLQQHLPTGERNHVGRRFLEEFDRYMGDDHHHDTHAAMPTPTPDGQKPGNWGAADY